MKITYTTALIEEAGCKLIYLPPYSPDLNPIERFWSWLKKKIGSIMSKYTSSR
jgi:transposase